jgi:undecaprenyl-phosphate 4-deoxy-4-formamido-L-arabinose transferase
MTNMLATPLEKSGSSLIGDSLPAEVAISVVIPVYNSAKTLERLHARLTAVLGALGHSYEIVLVDDGSRDDSWNGLLALRALDPEHIVAIQLMRNFGQHNALMCGLAAARGAHIFTMDDDLQNPPEEIAKMLACIKNEKLDLVYGCPSDRKHASWRNVGSNLVRQFYRVVFRNAVTPTPFRVMTRQLAKRVMFYDLNFTFLDGLLAWCTSRIGEVEVEHHPRAEGKSNYSLGKLMGLALNLYTNFSLLPLQVVSGMGLLIACTGFLGGFYFLMQYLVANILVPGYASTIIAILILGGAQLLAIGVIGEYLGRLHLNVNRKPQYVVRQLVDHSSGTAASQTTRASTEQLVE